MIFGANIPVVTMTGISEGTTCGLDDEDEGSMTYDELDDDDEDSLAGASLFQVLSNSSMTGTIRIQIDNFSCHMLCFLNVNASCCVPYSDCLILMGVCRSWLRTRLSLIK